MNLVFSLFSGAACFWLRQIIILSVVVVSAILALSSGLSLPPILMEGELFALTCTAVSFAAMCSSERCCSYRELLIISAICSLVIYFGQSVLVGIGGSLGTSAAVSVLLCRLARRFLSPDHAQ